MRDFGRVRTAFWDDPDVKGCSAAAKMMALYLITSQHTNAIGLFRLPIAYMQDDTGLTKQQVEQAFSELRDIGYVEHCERLPWIWIPKFLKHNAPENSNVWRKCVKDLISVPYECNTAARSVAGQLQKIASESRFKNGQTCLKEHEITDLERFRNGIETVTDTLVQGQRPYPCPIPEPLPDPIQETNAQPQAADTLVASPEPAVISIPTNRRDEEFSVLESHVAEFERTYPALDIRKELREMRMWAIANPRNRKTSDGMMAFINRWLAKHQNQSGSLGKSGISPHDKGTRGAALWLAGQADDGDGTGTPSGSLPTNGHGRTQVGIPVRRILERLPAPDGGSIPVDVQGIPGKS